jgi:dihydrofolate synthase/folylpolyglutamate synthase
MPSYHATLRYLYSLQHRGMKLGLRNVRTLVRAAGNPELGFPSVHVAGTNGKGSTSSFLAACFTSAGYRTGLYTSPHLEKFNERIRIDGCMIPDADIVRLTEMLRPAIERTRATFFEATTVIAFRWFAEEGVDVAVIETGLGGRLDATNVLNPMISVITNVAMDHQEYLGDTISKIAREKGGIIKPRTPVATAAEDPDVLRVLRGIARKRRAKLYWARQAVRMDRKPALGRVAMTGTRLSLRGVRPGLPGLHQLSNARLAVAVIDVLMRDARFSMLYPQLNASAVARGLARVRACTGLRGRLQRAGPGGRYLLDVAHNPDGIAALVRTLRQTFRTPLTVVFGVMKDKDYRGMLEGLRPVTGRLVAVAPRNPRALPATRLRRVAERLKFRTVLGGSVASGMRKAGKGLVLIVGSHYVVGEACTALGVRLGLDRPPGWGRP